MVRLEKYRSVGICVMVLLLASSSVGLIVSIAADCDAFDTAETTSVDLKCEPQSGQTRIVDDAKDIVDVRHVDIGVVTQGSRIEHVFAIRNQTSKPLVINSIQKSCGCQFLELEHGTTLPAGKVLMFAYGLPSSVPGLQSGKLVIQTDSTDESLRVITLGLQVDVRAVLNVTPSALRFRKIPTVGFSQHHLRVTSLDSELLSRFRDAVTTKNLVTVTLESKAPDMLLFGVAVRAVPVEPRFHDVIVLRFENLDHSLVKVFVPVDGVIENP